MRTCFAQIVTKDYLVWAALFVSSLALFAGNSILAICMVFNVLASMIPASSLANDTESPPLEVDVEPVVPTA
jgi:hypothetical protein